MTVVTPRLRASVVCIHQGKLLTVKLQDPHTKVERLFPPGGGVQGGETPAQAALRETKEETGYEVRLDPKSEIVENYPFQWNGTIYACTTHFFKATLEDPKNPPNFVSDAPFHRGISWIPLAQIDKAFAYDVVICRAIKALA